MAAAAAAGVAAEDDDEGAAGVAAAAGGAAADAAGLAGRRRRRWRPLRSIRTSSPQPDAFAGAGGGGGAAGEKAGAAAGAVCGSADARGVGRRRCCRAAAAAAAALPRVERVAAGVDVEPGDGRGRGVRWARCGGSASAPAGGPWPRPCAASRSAATSRASAARAAAQPGGTAASSAAAVREPAVAELRQKGLVRAGKAEHVVDVQEGRDAADEVGGQLLEEAEGRAAAGGG